MKKTSTTTRTYSELILLETFEERFKYLRLSGKVGEDTFGFDRWLNQFFYRTPEWKRLRDEIIVRDSACDLAHKDYPIFGRVIIHHMNPIDRADILDRSDLLLNPEYLVCISHKTHNAVHYGDQNQLPKGPIERKPGDTKLW